MGPKKLCGTTISQTRAHHLLPFAELVFSYRFEDEPDYSQLKWLLERVLLNQNIAPSNKFDWIKSSKENSPLKTSNKNKIAQNVNGNDDLQILRPLS